MGFDLYGLNPVNPDNLVRPTIDWSKKNSKETEKKYFAAVETYEDAVTGSYFRNNVWFWRPLWQFVCASCDNVLTEKDMDRGSFNDGHKISKTKALRIASKLEKLLKLGIPEEMEKVSRERAEKAAKHNAKVREEMDKVTDACEKEHGENIVPADFPEPYKSQWDKAYAKRDWGRDYPFVADNVKHFAEFCKTSGGFEIC